MSCEKINMANEAGTDVWVGRMYREGLQLLGSHWWLGWAKPVLVINHQRSCVTQHGFIQDFEHSGKQEEDKREVTELGKKNKYRQNNFIKFSAGQASIFLWDEASGCIAHCCSGSDICTILFFGYFNQIHSNYLSHQKSCRFPCEVLQFWL